MTDLPVRAPASRRAWGWLIRLHRWLGVGGAGVFVLWFSSGLVLVYHRMPRLSTAERLGAVSALVPGRIRFSPADAVRRAKAPVDQVRLTMLLDRPVYRVLSPAGRWDAVYADDGLPVPPADSTLALRVAAQLSRGAALRYRGLLVDPDQWSLSAPIRRQGPLHLIAVDDGAGTELYVSRSGAEAVMKTTRASRFWGYAGAVTHWFFFTPLRRRTAVWSRLVIYGALAGSLLCLSGIAVGLYRFRLRPRYRAGRVTPHHGWLRWHHFLGLAFGLITFTWIFSGMLSMTPWDWSPGSTPTAAERRAAAGGALDPDRLVVGPRQAISRLDGAGSLKEVELLEAGGHPFYHPVRPPANAPETPWENTDEAGYLGAEAAWPTSLLVADDPAGVPISALSRAVAESAAAAGRPGVPVVEQRWLEHYDRYWYHRRPDGRPLPILRTRFADGHWLYLDPRVGAPVLSLAPVSRVERWLYHGLHSLDFPGLYQAGGWWELVVIVGSAGGLLLSGSAMVIGARRVRRSALRNSPR